jgi:RNA polymerase sigma factor (sigma-70 family)
MEPTPPQALWPEHLARLVESTRCCRAPAERDTLRGELWAALHAALMRFLRLHARAGRASREDLEDLAASKALELLGRAESGAWDPAGRSGDEIAGYVSTVARHGLVDLARRAGRELPMDDLAQDRSDLATLDAPPASRAARPEADVEGRELGRALRQCFETLDPRGRRVWFFRAYYEMSSREIGAHPDVAISASHVDVVAQRAREAIVDCMKGKGHDTADLPAGAFVMLWESLELLAASEGVATRATPTRGSDPTVRSRLGHPGNDR